MKRLTRRGFGMYAEFDYQNYPGYEPKTFQVQESSAADRRMVWVGTSGLDRAHLNEEEGRLVRDGLNEFLDEGAAAGGA